MQRQMGTKERLVDCLIGLAAIAISGGRVARAALLVGKIEALCQEDIHAISAIDQNNHDRTVEAIRNQLGDTAFNVARAAGHSMSVDDILAGGCGGDEIEQEGKVRPESASPGASPVWHSRPAPAGLI